MGLIACAADEYAISYVLGNLRPHSQAELCATRLLPVDAALREVRDQVEELRPYAIIRVALFSSEGAFDPIGIAIAYQVSPVIAVFQSFSTHEWPVIALPFVRWFRRGVVPLLEERGIRMAEAHILLTPEYAPRWWQAMDLRPAGAPEPRGVRGELYQRMVWFNFKAMEADDVQHRQGVRADRHRTGNGRSGSCANPTAGGAAKTDAAARTATAGVNGSHYGGDAGADEGGRGRTQGRAAGVR